MRRSARPRAERQRGRALLASTVLFAGAGAALLGLALRSSADADEAVLEVSAVTAEAPPSTIAPLAEPPPPPSTTPAPVEPTPPSTVPISPLAALLGEAGSAIPPGSTARIQPTALTIADVAVDHPVRSVGLEDDGQLEVPDATEIGWYRYGAAPGHPGATVLAAHVSWNGDLGPFLRLGELEPGDRVEVALQDGSQRIYEVVERTMYDKNELPRERIWRNSGDETLVLITCGGDFNRNINRYRQNIVVYAVPVGTVAAPMS